VFQHHGYEITNLGGKVLRRGIERKRLWRVGIEGMSEEHETPYMRIQHFLMRDSGEWDGKYTEDVPGKALAALALFSSPVK